MRKLAISTIVGLTIMMSLPYILHQQWWGFMLCLIAGLLWLYPSAYRVDMRSTISIVIFVFIGTLGIFFNQDPLWSLTNFFVLLVAWDLDRYTRVYQEFEKDRVNKKSSSILFHVHTKRLLIVAGSGWILGFAALNIRIQITFSLALLLILFLMFSFRQVAHYLADNRK